MPPESAYLDRFPPQDEESFRALRRESRELVNQDVFYFVRLLDLYADPHAVDAGLDQDPLVLVSRYGQGVQEHFGGAGSFDFGDVVPFRGLRCEVGEGEGGRERLAYALEVWAERLGLRMSAVSAAIAAVDAQIPSCRGT